MATFVALADPARPARRLASFRLAGWLWSGLLLAILAFLVLYPTFMLLYGALSGTNPVVDGFNLSAISLDNFIEVLANSNVHFALVNTLVICSGGTAIAGPGASVKVNVKNSKTGRLKGRFVVPASLISLASKSI